MRMISEALARVRAAAPQPNLPLLFLGVTVPLAVFGKLAREVWEQEGFAFDLPILEAAHRYASPGLDVIMVAVTKAAFRT